jgi:hypothetical protein
MIDFADYLSNPTNTVKEPASPADWIKEQPMDFFMDCGNFGVGDLIMNVLRAIETFAHFHQIEMEDVRIVDFVWRGEILPLTILAENSVDKTVEHDQLTSDDCALILTLEDVSKR